jgi:hypothetical protein
MKTSEPVAEVGLNTTVSAECAAAAEWLIEVPLVTTCITNWSTGALTSLNAGDVGTADMSFEAWVLDKYGPAQVWPAYGGSNTIVDQYFVGAYRGTTGFGGSHYLIGFLWQGNANTNYGAIYTANAANNYVLTYVNVVAHNGLPHGEWSHVCITAQKDTPGVNQVTLNEYINGVLYATRVTPATEPADWNDGADPVDIVCDREDNDPDVRTPAYLGPWAIHLDVLTAEQVAQHYNGRTVGIYDTTPIAMRDWVVRNDDTGEVNNHWFISGGPQEDYVIGAGDANGDLSIASLNANLENSRMVHVYPAGTTTCTYGGCYVQAEGTLQRKINVYFANHHFGWPGFA